MKDGAYLQPASYHAKKQSTVLFRFFLNPVKRLAEGTYRPITDDRTYEKPDQVLIHNFFDLKNLACLCIRKE